MDKTPYNIVVGIISSLLASVVWQVMIAVIPLAVGASLLFFRVNAQIVAAFLAVGWTGSCIAFVFWFADHREHRKNRIITFGRMMFVSDHHRNSVVAKLPNQLELPVDARHEFEYLLLTMCDILAYRLAAPMKGASILVPRKESFDLFVNAHHDDASVGQEIRSKVRLDNSLAGFAMKENGFVALRDCRAINAKVPWANNHMPPRYVGRAATPIRVVAGDDIVTVGVLCFDVKKPWSLTPEDQEIFLLVADKIGALWLQYQKSDEASCDVN